MHYILIIFVCCLVSNLTCDLVQPQEYNGYLLLLEIALLIAVRSNHAWILINLFIYF